MDFKAAMFDFDGTVTEKGVFYPPQEMADTLAALSKKVPIAFCTGRQLESFEEHGLKILLEEIDVPERQAFLENLYLMGENGAIGYFFNTNIDEFEEFYRAPWPDHFINREELKILLNKEIAEFGSIKPHHNHRVVIVMSTKNHGSEETDIEGTYQLSSEIYEITCGILRRIDPEFEKYLHVGNSGIGVLVGPADGDKDLGIKKFAEFLNESRMAKIDPKAREILVVGDRPQKGGNDEYLLNGVYGTPYTVGNYDESMKWLSPVLDENGERLLHFRGTIYLLKKSFSL
jgi:HAD superfamily hydrolase (TIGR01484 family)